MVFVKANTVAVKPLKCEGGGIKATESFGT